MRIMLDTNIIISVALFPNGRAAQAFFKALQPPYQPLDSEGAKGEQKNTA